MTRTVWLWLRKKILFQQFSYCGRCTTCYVWWAGLEPYSCTSYDISQASDWPSRPIRSLRYIVTCTRIRALGHKVQSWHFSMPRIPSPADMHFCCQEAVKAYSKIKWLLLFVFGSNWSSFRKIIQYLEQFTRKYQYIKQSCKRKPEGICSIYVMEKLLIIFWRTWTSVYSSLNHRHFKQSACENAQWRHINLFKVRVDQRWWILQLDRPYGLGLRLYMISPPVLTTQ